MTRDLELNCACPIVEENGGNLIPNLVSNTLTIGSPALGNYLYINEQGQLTLFGNARAWVDLIFSLGRVELGASAPDVITIPGTGIRVLAFDGLAIAEQISASEELNHYTVENGALHAHVHWYPTTADAGNVKWQLEYIVVDNGAVVGASTTLTVTQAASGAWVHQRADFPLINGLTWRIGAQIFVRLFRNPIDAADTYARDAAVSSFGVHLLADGFGSKTEFDK